MGGCDWKYARIQTLVRAQTRRPGILKCLVVRDQNIIYPANPAGDVGQRDVWEGKRLAEGLARADQCVPAHLRFCNAALSLIDG